MNEPIHYNLDEISSFMLTYQLEPRILAVIRMESQSPRVLVVVAHPDDEYHFAVTLYRIVHELGGMADQLIITDGGGGHSYSSFAERLYGFSPDGRGSLKASLREIRRSEVTVAGQVLGIRQHFFLDQQDTGFTLNHADAITDWNHQSVTEALDNLLAGSRYDFVFTLLPAADTHGHHKAAALLTLEAVSRLPHAERPVVLAAEAAEQNQQLRPFHQLDGHPSTRVASQTFSISRKEPHHSDCALNYQIIANWVIAAHKSQGLFQMEAGRHDVERFWRFETGGLNAAERANSLFQRLRSPHAYRIGIPA